MHCHGNEKERDEEENAIENEKERKRLPWKENEKIKQYIHICGGIDNSAQAKLGVV